MSDKILIKQFKNKAKKPVAGLTPEHAIYDKNGVRLDAKLGNVNLAEFRKAQDDGVNTIKAQQTTSEVYIEGKVQSAKDEIDAKHEEVSQLSQASMVGYTDNQGLGATNVQGALDNVGEKVEELEEQVNVIVEDEKTFEDAIRDQVNSYKPIVINGDVTNAADEEDLHADPETRLISLANRSALFGKGYVIIRKGIPFAEQVNKVNTIYEIRYDCDLNNDVVELPSKCILKFVGGSIRNGSIVAKECFIEAANVRIFYNIKLDGNFTNGFNVQWWGVYGNTPNEDDSRTNFVDETDSLQEVFNSVPTHSRVEINNGVGVVLITRPIEINKFNIKFGSSQDTQYKPTIWSISPTFAFVVNGTGFNCSNISLRGDLAQSGTANFVNSGIKINPSNNVDADASVNNCLFFYMKTAIAIVGRNVDVINCQFLNCKNGVFVQSPLNEQYNNGRGYRFIGNRFHSIGQGEFSVDREIEDDGTFNRVCIQFKSPNSGNVQILNNMVDGKSSMFYVGGLKQTIICNNIGTLMCGIAIYIIDRNNIYWESSLISNNSFSGVEVFGEAKGMDYGIYIKEAYQLSILNNSIANSIKDAIRIDKGYVSNIKQNYIVSPNFKVSENEYAGIIVAQGNAVSISDNFVRTTKGQNTFKWGIYNGTENSTISNNIVQNAQVAVFNLYEAATYYQNSVESNKINSFERSNIVGSGAYFSMFGLNSERKKTEYASLHARLADNTAGAECGDVQILAKHNGTNKLLAQMRHGGSWVVGSGFSGTMLEDDGALNAAKTKSLSVAFEPSNYAPNNNSISVHKTNDNLRYRSTRGTDFYINYKFNAAEVSDAYLHLQNNNFVKLPTITADRNIGVNAIPDIDTYRIWCCNNSDTYVWKFGFELYDLNGNNIQWKTLKKGNIYTITKFLDKWVLIEVSNYTL